jgi:hypothetical protein
LVEGQIEGAADADIDVSDGFVNGGSELGVDAVKSDVYADN